MGYGWTSYRCLCCEGSGEISRTEALARGLPVEDTDVDPDGNLRCPGCEGEGEIIE